MKGKRSISFLITGMIALTNILGSASTVFAKESMNYEITTSDYETKVVINKREMLDCIDRATLLIKEGDKKPIIITIIKYIKNYIS